jgi:hypothetical protein
MGSLLKKAISSRKGLKSMNIGRDAAQMRGYPGQQSAKKNLVQGSGTNSPTTANTPLSRTLGGV